MPLPALAVAGIAAGAQLGSSAVNAISQGKMNRKQRQWAEKMYTQQREDNLIAWNRQNAYDSPAEQMKRYKEAKLNPHLIYGQMSNSAPIKTADAPSWSPRAPELNLDAAPVLSAYYDAQQKPIQTDNLAKQGALLDKQSLLLSAEIDNKLANTESTIANTNRSKFDLSLASDLRQNSLDYAQQNLRKLEADTKYTLDNNDRQAAMTSSNLMEAVERVLKSRAERTKISVEQRKLEQEIRNLHLDESLKADDLQLRRIGATASDSVFMKKVAEAVDKLTSSEHFERVKKNLDNFKRAWRSFAPFHP